MFHRRFTGLSTANPADERFPGTLQFCDSAIAGQGRRRVRLSWPAPSRKLEVKPMLRLSANLSWLFTEVPFLERFGEAARAGFRGVEFAFAYDVPERAIADRLAEHRLQCVLINAPPGDYAAGERGIAALPGREEEFVASFATALRYAAALGCPRIHVMAGLVPEVARRSESRATFISNLRHACEAARAQGVSVLNYLFSTVSEAHAIREAVGAPNIKAQMDFYHTQVVEGDLATKAERWLPDIAHIQIAGTPGRHEPDIGEINYAWLLRRVEELGYGGWVGCEYRPLTTTAAGLSWRDRLVPLRPIA